jgi:hypothetical protein
MHGAVLLEWAMTLKHYTITYIGFEYDRRVLQIFL